MILTPKHHKNLKIWENFWNQKTTIRKPGTKTKNIEQQKQYLKWKQQQQKQQQEKQQQQQEEQQEEKEEQQRVHLGIHIGGPPRWSKRA